MDVIAAIVSAVITAYLLFSVLFGSREEFLGCVKFWFTPDVFSIFKGQFYEDQWGEVKLLVWIVCSAGVGYGVHTLFH